MTKEERKRRKEEKLKAQAERDEAWAGFIFIATYLVIGLIIGVVARLVSGHPIVLWQYIFLSILWPLFLLWQLVVLLFTVKI